MQIIYRLLKSVLQETLCLLSISGSISPIVFQQFDLTVASFNQMWKQQEEIKRAKSLEEESLYVKKYVVNLFSLFDSHFN